MEESRSFELPKASDKLSYKFILDSLRERRLESADPRECHQEESTAQIENSMEEPVIAVLGPDFENQSETVENGENLNSTTPTFRELNLPPEKKYFRIGEAAQLIGVEPYVLRYWESEFSGIRPHKSGSGHRVYSRKDVQRLHYIRHLLHIEKFSVKGAKKKLSEKKTGNEIIEKDLASRKQHRESLRALSHQIKELVQLAKKNPGIF